MNEIESSRGKKLALTGAILQLGPLVGLLGTVVSVIHGFNTLESSSPGIADPQRLRANVGETLYATIAGLILSLIGLVLLFIALFGCRYRAEWFFWFLVIYGALLLFGFPIGTVIGLIFIIFCLTRKHEFLHFNTTSRNA
jgi:MotA/TolQ/ExbB proton channel family protein